MRVLLVGIEDILRIQLIDALNDQSGFSVSTVTSLADADSYVIRHQVEAFVLDLDGLGAPALSWCARMTSERGSSGVLFVTSHDDEHSCVEVLDAGADDCLQRPERSAELRARLRAIHRRRPVAEASRVTRGEVTLDFARRHAVAQGSPVQLTAAEWSILAMLHGAAGEVVSRQKLTGCFGEVAPGGSRSLEVLIARIRKKLGPESVRTVRGGGYACP